MNDKAPTADVAALADSLGKLPASLLPSQRQIRTLIQISNITSRAGIGDRRPERNFAVFLKGLECGVPPMEALESISLGDDGKMSLNASLMHAKLIESGKGRIQWLERSEKRVVGRFVRNDDPDHPVDISWSIDEEATEAGLAGRSSYRKYPRQMLTARVISEGCALVFPDVVTARSYTPDELGADDDTAVDDIDFEDPTPARFQAPAKQDNGSTPQAAAQAPPMNMAATAQAFTESEAKPAMLTMLKTLVAWAGITAAEWREVLRPYHVKSATELEPDKLYVLLQSMFDRYTPFDLRAAGLDARALTQLGFKLDEENALGKAGTAATSASVAQSPTTANSSHARTETQPV